MKDCAGFRLLIQQVHADPETFVQDELALHLDQCAACRKLFDAAKVELDPDAFEIVPAAVRRSLVDALAAARRPSRSSRRLVAVAAAAVLVLFAGIALVVEVGRRGREPADAPLLAVLVEDHVRYLRHPDRRAGADRAELSAYLQEYVDFPVVLPEPPDTSFVGARRCLVLDRRAVLAFYDTPAGPASYFVFPEDGLARPAEPCPGARDLSCQARRGYHLVRWYRAGLVHAWVGTEPSVLVSMARACRAAFEMEDRS